MKSKIKIANILLLILTIIALVLVTMIALRSRETKINEENIKNVISQVHEDIKDNTAGEIPYVEYHGYQVIGTIQIQKVNIEYPILNINTPASLKKSIVRFGNGKVNEVGNLCLAGHNNMNGTMFGKLKQLEINDEVSILDLYGNEIIYKVFDKYITNPNDVSVLESIDAERREITLITCTNGNKQRLIIRAAEI